MQMGRFCQRQTETDVTCFVVYIPPAFLNALPSCHRASRCHMQVATYSCQSDKVVNSGEGGFLTTNDEELFSKAIFMSGCYERRYREGKNKEVYTFDTSSERGSSKTAVSTRDSRVRCFFRALLYSLDTSRIP